MKTQTRIKKRTAVLCQRERISFRGHLIYCQGQTRRKIRETDQIAEKTLPVQKSNFSKETNDATDVKIEKTQFFMALKILLECLFN